MIIDYLADLLDELRLPQRRAQRILAEVEDHLACAAAELHAEGLAAAEAEREAVKRFGPAAELARSFAEQEAALSSRRTARATVALALLFAFLVLGSPAPTLAGFPVGLLAFVLAQVAVVAGALTLVRAWRGPGGARLVLILRGSLVVICCAACTVACAAIAGAVRGGPSLGGWIALATIALGTAGTAVALAKSWGRARIAGAAKRIDTADDALADIEAVTMTALEQLGRRVPGLKRACAHGAQFVRVVSARLRWLDLRRHPWRFAVAVALSAGLAGAVGHGLTEGGIPTHHLLRALLGGAIITAIEAAAALLGFALLGNYLGIRRRTTD